MISKYTSPVNLDEIIRRMTRLTYIGKTHICSCGVETLTCKLKHNGEWQKGRICTSCGNVYIEDKIFTKVRGAKACCM